MLDFHEGINFPGVVNGKQSILKILEKKLVLENRSEIRYKRLHSIQNSNRNGLETSDKCKTIGKQSFPDIRTKQWLSVFNILFPGFLQ